MKFGVSLIMRGKHASPEAFVKLARHAEALDYDAVWATDHLFFPKVPPGAHREGPHSGLPATWEEGYWECFAVLGYVAAHTQRIALGTSVLILPMHNPIETAKRVSVLDRLSGGRFIFGVGVGWLKEEFEGLRWPFAERGARTDEGLEICRKLWTEDKPSHAGRFYNFESAWFDPKPLQKPHPPIWVGGHSAPALKRVARFGDGWHSFRPTHQLMAEKVPELKRYLEERGRKLQDIRIAPKMTVTFQDGPPQKDQAPTEGRPRDILDALRRFQDQGATDFVIDVRPEALDHAMATLSRFAEEVRAKL